VNAARAVCAASAALLIVLALTVLRPPETAAGSLRDFQVYRAAGATWRKGVDPYSVAIAAKEPLIPSGSVLPFVGPPASLPWWAMFARLPAGVAAMLWRAVLVCALIALVCASAACAGARSPFDFVCVGLLSLAFAPLTSAIALGQTAIVAASLAATGLYARRRTALVAACAFGALALQPNVALGLFAIVRRRSTLVGLAIAILAIYACGAIALGPAWPVSYAHALAAHAVAERGSVLQFTPASIAAGFAVRSGLATPIAVSIGCIAAAVALYAARRVRDERAGFVAMSCALPFVCGFFHGQDLAALFLPVVVSLRTSAPSARGLALIAAVAVGANWLDFAQSPPALAADLALGGALVVASIATLPEIDARALIWTCACLALLGGGTWLAATHPIPVWPDAMRRFVMPAHATPAQAWYAELTSAGFFVPHAASAILRSIALGGCAITLALTLLGSDVNVHEVVERRDAVGVEVL